ncbi:MAG: hypothetical protein ACE366_14800 [Bradymonadia bacterium]
MSAMRHRGAVRRWGPLALGLWLWAVVLLPLVHMWGHDTEHHHGAHDHGHHHAHEHHHEHGHSGHGAHHDDFDPMALFAPENMGPETDADDAEDASEGHGVCCLAHGDGSLAHGDAWLLLTAITLPLTVTLPVAETPQPPEQIAPQRAVICGGPIRAPPQDLLAPKHI